MLDNFALHRRCQRLGLLLSVAFLGACTTVALPVRTGSAIGGKTEFVRHRHGVCWPGELDRTPIVSIAPAPIDQFTAGYHNRVIRGQSCHTQHSFSYSGAVRFDLEDLRGRVVSSAVLRMDRSATPVPVHIERPVPSGIVRESSCSLRVEVATTDWSRFDTEGRYETRVIPAEWPITVPQDNALVETGTGVLWAVQQWVLGRLPNHGFVLRPQPDDIANNDNTCTGYWFNPRLEISVFEATSR